MKSLKIWVVECLKVRFVLAYFGWVVVLVTFWGAAVQAQSQPLRVVATTGMIGDLVKNIGQDKVALEVLMGVGVDPHLYKATQGDLRRIQRADVIFYNGLHLEGKMQAILEKIARKKPVFAVTDRIPRSKLLYLGQGSNSVADPHVWFDVLLWRQAAEAVLQRLVEQDRANAAFYRAQAKRYFARLEALDAWVRQQILTIPKPQRILITAHDAFGYFGRAYDMEVRGLQGMSTATEFGLHDIKRLKDLIVARKVKAVFVESSVPKKFLQSLVAGVRESGVPLTIGGELYSDAMGLPNSPAGTYEGMVRHNVETIVKALK